MHHWVNSNSLFGFDGKISKENSNDVGSEVNERTIENTVKMH